MYSEVLFSKKLGKGKKGCFKDIYCDPSEKGKERLQKGGEDIQEDFPVSAKNFRKEMRGLKKK